MDISEKAGKTGKVKHKTEQRKKIWEGLNVERLLKKEEEQAVIRL